MSPQLIKVLIAGILLVHGLGHGGAIGALITIDRGVPGGQWKAAHSWLFPNLAPKTAKTVATIFWALSLVGFVVAALSFWGWIFPISLWRPVALVFAFISFTGIALFWGNWPVFNTLAAQAVNLAVIVTQLFMHWPPQDMFGR